MFCGCVLVSEWLPALSVGGRGVAVVEYGHICHSERVRSGPYDSADLVRKCRLYADCIHSVKLSFALSSLRSPALHSATRLLLVTVPRTLYPATSRCKHRQARLHVA